MYILDRKRVKGTEPCNKIRQRLVATMRSPAFFALAKEHFGYHLSAFDVEESRTGGSVQEFWVRTR